jgi:outer membrane receptor protein involved in Fe transport
VQNPRFQLPAPTNSEIITDFGSQLGRFVFGTDTPRRKTIFTARVDHNFTDTHSIVVSYQFGNTNDRRQFNGGNRLAEALIGRRSKTNAINFTDNYVFNAKTVNQFRLQYSDLSPQFISTGQEQNPVVIISFREPGQTSNTSLLAGSSTLGTSDRKEKRWQVQDSLTRIIGAHNLKFGFDVQNINSEYIDLTDANGTFNFADPLATTTIPQCLINPNLPPSATNPRIRGGVNAFPRGCVSRFRQNFFTDSTQKNTYYGLFVQDDWKLLENLNLSLGLRYERETIIDDTNNFGPRFAVAYSPFKDNKTVVRFGGGIFYNRVLLRTVDDFQRGQNEVIFDTNRVSTTGGARDSYLLALSNGFPNTLSANSPLVQRYIAEGYNQNSFFRSLDPTLKIPESYQFNLGFERELSKSFVLKLI